MHSLRAALSGIRVDGAWSWRTGLTGPPPGTLRELMLACKSPRMSEWTNPARTRAENRPWTEELNGMVSDGEAWFASANAGGGREGVYRLGMDLSVHGFLRGPAAPQLVHLGALCVRGPWLYIPTQQSRTLPEQIDCGPITINLPNLPSLTGIWRVSTDLGSASFFPADELPDDDMFAWCDIHPSNGLLYTSSFSAPTRLLAYELRDGLARYVASGNIPLRQPSDGLPTTRVQAGCFSDRHRWYAVCDVDGAERIHVHTTLNGLFLERRMILADTDDGSVTRNELEGIWIQPVQTTSGAPAQVHVLELNNEAGSADDVYLWHLAAPDPSLI